MFYAIAIAVLMLAAYWIWGMRKMARMNNDPDQLPLALLLVKAGGYKVVQMKAKTPLETLPEYDAMMVKDLKVPAVSSRAIGNVVQTVSD